ncbi:hypothetical protein SCHPADRAFT_988793, partial [Schizopora paradoxa]
MSAGTAGDTSLTSQQTTNNGSSSTSTTGFTGLPDFNGNKLNLFLPSEKLDRKNYIAWERQLRLAFTRFKLWDIVNGSKPKPTARNPATPTEAETAEIAQWEASDMDAQAIIFKLIDSDFFAEIGHLSTSADIWLTLAQSCRTKGTLGAVHWIRRLANARYDESTDLQKHITIMLGYVRELAFTDLAIPETVT